MGKNAPSGKPGEVCNCLTEGPHSPLRGISILGQGFQFLARFPHRPLRIKTPGMTGIFAADFFSPSPLGISAGPSSAKTLIPPVPSLLQGCGTGGGLEAEQRTRKMDNL